MQKREVPIKCFGCVYLGLYVDMGARVPVCKRYSSLLDGISSIDKDEDSCSFYSGLHDLNISCLSKNINKENFLHET